MSRLRAVFIPVNVDFKRGAWRIMPWLSSLLVVLSLMVVMLLMEGESPDSGKVVTVRDVDVAPPPPPEPPPPVKTRSSEPESVTPSVDLVGPAEGPSLDYSENPKLAMPHLEKVDRPEFDTSALDLKGTISVDVPVLEVKELDEVPRLVSNNQVRFPRELRKRGVSQVITTVEIIIDQNGSAFVKKIVDPVYPVMRDVIRKAINNSRFTVPKKNGKPVQAVYLYNLKFVDLTF